MKQKIVVLDGRTLTPDPGTGESAPPGEPTWTALQQLGDLHVYDRTPDELVVERARDAAIVLTNKTPLTAETFAALPDLRYVGVFATGTNVVDLAAARAHNITVTNVPGYSSDSVAQLVFGLLLELVNHVGAHDRAVHEGAWVRSEDFHFTVAPLTELAGKRLGIVGLGAIGRRVAQLGHAFGMNIMAAHQRSMHRVSVPGVDVKWLPVDELFAEADVVTLHCPLTEQTRHMVNQQRLAHMKPSAILINTGRGDLVDESAVAAALRDGRIAAAGVDVLSSEPPAADNPLLSAPRCLITPHIGWATREARCRLMAIATANVQAFLAGRPQNVVNS